MSRRQDSRTPRQRFTELVQAELDTRMVEHDWSVSQFIRESGVGRATIYDWLKPESTRVPQVEKVQLYAANLGIPYEPYAEALGWSETEEDSPAELEGFIRRAQSIAEHPKTSPERRRALEAQIRIAESTLRGRREAETRLREARDMEWDAEALLREALGESEDADT